MIVPITAVLIPLAPIVSAALFGYGAADRSAAFQIGYTVIGMLVGLVPFSIYFILLRGWYSMEDTKTPFFLSLVLNAINVVLSIALFYAVPTQWKVPAIGLALGLTYWLMMLVAWPVLARRVEGMHTRATWTAVLRMMLAGAVTAGVATAVFLVADQALPTLWSAPLQKLAVLSLAGLVGLLAYLLMARLLRVREVAAAVSLLRRRLRR